MPAYSEMYLDDAMCNLGEAVDHAVNRCGLDMDQFFGLFVGSGIADQFGKGNPKYVSGMSGTELAHEILDKVNCSMPIPRINIEFEASPEYWCGWMLACYQHKSGLSFSRIFEKVHGETLLRLYPDLHELPEERIFGSLDKILNGGGDTLKIQQLRKNSGYSQSMLAKRSGVNLRTLQQYETGAKDINKAAGTTLKALADTLGVSMEDLMEPGEGN